MIISKVSPKANFIFLRAKSHSERKRGIFLFFCFFIFLFLCVALAQEKEAEGGFSVELTGRYLREHKYNECVDYLESLKQKNKDLEPLANSYIAMTRYYQLKYLEEIQDWNEYFANGTDYRRQILTSAQKAIDKTLSKEPANIQARLILWRLHKDQEDGLDGETLSGLMSSILEYSKEPIDPELIKQIADQLSFYQEKQKAKQLYLLYAQNLIAKALDNGSLEAAASDFYKAGNIELAQAFYDAYMDRIGRLEEKGKAAHIFMDIAKKFSCKGEGLKDVFYAEKVFKKLEAAAGKDIFDEEALYLRALNLEKTKEYIQAKDLYIELISRFPEGAHFDGAVYRIGVIDTYVLRDIKNGSGYFEKLSQKKVMDSEAVSSLYQLGLLAQWSNDLVKAKEYYDALIEKSGSSFPEKTALARKRLSEIEQIKPIEYNLKTFLDVSLKEENSIFDMTKIDLRLNENPPVVNVNAVVYLPQSGCMQVELEYLWSGDLGGISADTKKSGFDTTYQDKGVKVINLVVTSYSGIIDRSIELIDVN